MPFQVVYRFRKKGHRSKEQHFTRSGLVYLLQTPPRLIVFGTTSNLSLNKVCSFFWRHAIRQKGRLHSPAQAFGT